MTRSDYQLLAVVACALVFAVVLNACFAFSVTRRADAQDEVMILHALINQYRQSQGLPAFLIDTKLMNASEGHNLAMRDTDCFAHQCPGEDDPLQRMRAAGYLSPASEVIGRGYPDAAAMLDGWQHSAAHNAILLGNWRDMGCAALREGVGGPWWTCDFGTAGTGSSPPPTASPGPPTPTATPDRRGPLPAGWLMRVWIADSSLPPCSMVGVTCSRIIEIDYDRSTWAVTDGLYGQYCMRGYKCEWLRRPPGYRPVGMEP